MVWCGALCSEPCGVYWCGVVVCAVVWRHFCGVVCCSAVAFCGVKYPRLWRWVVGVEAVDRAAVGGWVARILVARRLDINILLCKSRGTVMMSYVVWCSSLAWCGVLWCGVVGGWCIL